MSDWRHDMLLTSTEVARIRKARRLLREGSLEESVTRGLDQRLTSTSSLSARSGSVLSIASGSTASASCLSV